MSKDLTPSYASIVADLKSASFAPIYCLMGEEDYYIDRLSEEILNQALAEEERDFNYTLLYGAETRANDIINIARQYPMMAERRVVMVREFQALSDKETLVSYVKNPTPSTILILCNKHGVLDRRRTLGNEIKKNGGVIFESKRLYDRELPPFVTKYIESRQKTIEPAAAQMLCDHIGSDLSRLVAEMDKLILALPEGQSRIAPTLVEEQTGMSKDYNVFELQNALATRDVFKANQIVKYFDSNPRSFALPPTLSSLFGFFSDVLLAYYAPSQTDEGIAEYTGRNLWAARQALIPARRNYGGQKVLDIISEIRKTDAKSKGVGGCRTAPGDLLKELVFFILH